MRSERMAAYHWSRSHFEPSLKKLKTQLPRVWLCANAAVTFFCRKGGGFAESSDRLKCLTCLAFQDIFSIESDRKTKHSPVHRGKSGINKILEVERPKDRNDTATSLRNVDAEDRS